MLRKLRGICNRSSRGSEPAPPVPAMTVESETVDPSPRAIHASDVRRSPTKLPRKPVFDEQASVSMITVNANGAADYLKLYRLLQREKKYGEFDPTDNFSTDYFCDNCVYNVTFMPPSAVGNSLAYLCLIQHFCLIFTYDALSRDSWNEMAAAYESIRNRCGDGALPFVATMIAAMGEGEALMSYAEAEAFAAQRDCLFVKLSPINGRGICDAVGSLVELAHSARDRYATDQEGHTQRYKRGEALQALFPSQGCSAQD